MANKTGEVKLDTSGLDTLNKIFDNKKKVKVGILGNGKLAEIGFRNEFGTVGNNKAERIPARSFLRMPIELKGKLISKGVVKKEQAIKEAIKEGNDDILIETVGVLAEGVVQEAFATRGFSNWEPNADSTIRQKGSDSPLIDTGEMRQAITSEVESG